MRKRLFTGKRGFEWQLMGCETGATMQSRCCFLPVGEGGGVDEADDGEDDRVPVVAARAAAGAGSSVDEDDWARWRPGGEDCCCWYGTEDEDGSHERAPMFIRGALRDSSFRCCSRFPAAKERAL